MVSALPEHYRFQATVLHNLLCNTGWNRQSAEYDTNGELLRKSKNLVKGKEGGCNYNVFTSPCTISNAASTMQKSLWGLDLKQQ